MNQANQPNDKPKASPLMVGLPYITVGGEIGCLTVVIVFAAVFGGLYLDKLLGTKPVLTIIFVLGSAPLALVLTYMIAMRAVKRMTPTPKPTSVQPGKIYDEEDNSE